MKVNLCGIEVSRKELEEASPGEDFKVCYRNLVYELSATIRRSKCGSFRIVQKRPLKPQLYEGTFNLEGYREWSIWTFWRKAGWVSERPPHTRFPVAFECYFLNHGTKEWGDDLLVVLSWALEDAYDRVLGKSLDFPKEVCKVPREDPWSSP
jgi:hypothetical protein